MWYNKSSTIDVYDGPFADVQWHSNNDYPTGEPELLHIGDEEYAIHEVGPDDHEALAQFYGQLTAEQLSTRFGDRISQSSAIALGLRDSAATCPQRNWDTVLTTRKGAIIGHAGLTLFGNDPSVEFNEMHCSIHPSHALKRRGHGKRLAQVTVRASMAFGAPGVTASVKPHNTPVLKIMRKLPEVVGVDPSNLIEHMITDDDGEPQLVRFVLKLPKHAAGEDLESRAA